MKTIAQGAEAVLYLDKDRIIKERVPKTYRLKELDEELRRSRTRREAKVMSALPVNGPKLIRVDDKNMVIEMEYIEGNKLSDVLEKSDYLRLSGEIGRMLRTLHDKEIIHGDLTTSNMIMKKDSQGNDDVYFIDFGLSFFSSKTEDKAVDLHLLKQALESRHYNIADECFAEVEREYSDDIVLKRLEAVESRGRNKAKI